MGWWGSKLNDMLAHIVGTGSPHTAVGVGADPAGTAAGAVDAHKVIATGIHGLDAKQAQIDSLLAAQLIYFLRDAASDIGGYKQLQTAPDGGIIKSVAVALPAADTPIQAWLSAAGVPGAVTLPAGTFSIFFNAAKTSAPGTKDIQIYAKLFKRDGAGVETLLMTSALTGVITALSFAYPLYFVMPTSTVLVATDRLVFRLYGTPSGGGGDPTVTIYYEGTNDSNFSMPVPAGFVETLVAEHAGLDATHGTGALGVLGKVHSAAAAPTGAANAAAGYGPGWLWIDTTNTSAACLYAYAYEVAGVAVWRRMLLGDEQAGITGALGGALTAANPALSKASRPVIHLAPFVSSVHANGFLITNSADFLVPGTGRCAFLLNKAEFIAGYTWTFQGRLRSNTIGATVKVRIATLDHLGAQTGTIASTELSWTEPNPITGALVSVAIVPADFPAGTGLYQYCIWSTAAGPYGYCYACEIVGTPV